MTKKFEFLKPTPLSVMILPFVLLTVAAVFVSGNVTYSGDTDNTRTLEISAGFGSPIQITKTEESTTYVVRWILLAANLCAAYLLALLISRMFIYATGFRRPALTYGSFSVVAIAVTFLLSIGVSKYNWGYFMSRPPVLKEFNDIATVSAVIPFELYANRLEGRTFSIPDGFSIADRIQSCREDPYYCLDERQLVALDKRGLLPQTHSTSLSNLSELYSLIEGSEILVDSTGGYASEDRLRGIVVDALGESGERLVFIGVSGGQLSNDHYPHYEILYSGHVGSPDLSYIRGQRFFFDVAGLEGIEWYVIWPTAALFVLTTSFIAMPIAMLIWRLFRRKGSPPPLETTPEQANSTT